MSDKQRFPLDQARAVAEGLKAALGPMCSICEIAGSIRREKPDVGDIELVYVPHVDVYKDMFGNVLEEIHPVNAAIGKLMARGILAQRRNVNGSVTWGAQNKLAVHVPSGIPVDLFATRAECFSNYLVCRTGPAALNAEIAIRARARMLKWHPTGEGFENLNDGSPVRVCKEADVFEIVGLPYQEPKGRRWPV